MSQYRRYDEVAVGDVFPDLPLTFEVGGVVERFLAATGNNDPRYSEGKGVPSMVAAVYLIDLLKARGSPPGGIHAKQAIRFHRPLRRGDSLSIQASVVEKYVRKDKPYVVSDFEVRDAHGEIVSSGRITSIWGRDQ
jgi:acyl dehydratase